MNSVSVTTVLKDKWAWLAGCFCTVTIVTWLVLGQIVSPTYLSSGVVELGYFNPRDYQPHPVMSTKGLAALVNDPAFTGRVFDLADQQQTSGGGRIQITGAPLEDGLLRIEVRASTSDLAQTTATLACSLVVGITGEDYQREKTLIDGQLQLVRERAALAESLIHQAPKTQDKGTLQGGALRALALLTEIEVEKQTEAELVGQKKRSVVIVRPGPGIAEAPSTLAVAVGPGLVVTVLLAAAFLAQGSKRSEQQV